MMMYVILFIAGVCFGVAATSIAVVSGDAERCAECQRRQARRNDGD